MSDHGLTPTEKATAEALDVAVESIRTLAGWHVWPERRETLVVRAAGDKCLLLPTKKVVEVHAVRVAGVDVTTTTVVWEDGAVELSAAPPRGARVEVDLTHGLKKAEPLAAVAVAMAERAGVPSSSYTVGGISTGAPGSALTPQSTEWRVLDLYKLGPIP